MNSSLPRPYILEETNWKVVKEQSYELAILPWGATEAHNYHLPYGTDTIQVNHIARLAAQFAWNKGAKVIVLPCIPFGVNTGQLDIRLCMNLNPSSQLAILKDVADVLVRHQIYKLIILNGHGGNDFKSMIRELSFYYPSLFTCSINWYKAVDDKRYFDEPGDHAGELETSVMMHVKPEWVAPLDKAGSGEALSYKLDAFKEGWAIAQRPWSIVSKDTGVGNPQHATAEKGKQFAEAVSAKVGSFINALATHSIKELFQ